MRGFLPALLSLLLCAVPAGAVTYTLGSTVYTVATFPLPAVTDTTPFPTTLAIATDGSTLYTAPEFDHRLYSIARTATDATTMTATLIDAPASPLFRGVAGNGSFVSNQNECVQTTSDGSVWLAQGGSLFTTSSLNNWSRVMRRKPDTTWEAYTLPFDSAGAIGLLVTDPPNVLWVMAAGDNSMFTTRIRAWHEGENTATRYPPADQRWTKIRDFGIGPIGSFPAQLAMLKDGRLTGTLYLVSAFFFFDRRTSQFTDVALTKAPAGALLGSSGPWRIVQAPDEALWIAEDYAQRVTKYNIFTGAQTVFDLSGTLSADEHPHSIAIDPGTNDVFISTYPNSIGGNGRLVRITNAGVITYGPSLATISLAGGATGIVRDSTGAIWMALDQQRKVLRLTP